MVTRRGDPDVDLIAAFSLATGIGADSLLATPPEILDRQLELYVEQQARRERDVLKQKLRARGRGRT